MPYFLLRQLSILLGYLDAVLIGILNGVGSCVSLKVGIDLCHCVFPLGILFLCVDVSRPQLVTEHLGEVIGIGLSYVTLRLRFLCDAIVGVVIREELVVILAIGELLKLGSKLCVIGIAVNRDSVLGGVALLIS